jgi:hypothetical protein
VTKDRQVMLLGVPVGRCAVNAEADTVIGLGKTLEEMKARAALPRIQVDLVPAGDHNFLHAVMLNRRSLLYRCRREARLAGHLTDF